jgi:hypothetical protein
MLIFAVSDKDIEIDVRIDIWYIYKRVLIAAWYLSFKLFLRNSFLQPTSKVRFILWADNNHIISWMAE